MAKANKAKRPTTAPPDSAKSWREAVESIVIAIVLAFLFRAFEAEAFVIPTGSMAPTLQGRHKDVRCPECGYRYQAGDSLDAEVLSGPVEAVTCPACHYEQELNPRTVGDASNTGDRILVNKFAYEHPFGDPRRWDVIVFKYPGNAKQNYIKRCVGLEKETVRIHHGDIYVRPTDDQGNPSSDEFHIARKPPRKLQHMLQLVHDTRYRSEALVQSDWPLNWQAAGGSPGWTTSDGGGTYTCPSTDDTAWLHYRNYYLDTSTWDELEENIATGRPPLSGIATVETPVTDFYAYNAQTRGHRAGLMDQFSKSLGMHWVGDLAIEADVQIEGDAGQIQLILVEAGRLHRCRIDVASGRITLDIDEGRVPFGDGKSDMANELSCDSPIRGSGRYRLRFANIDNQLLCWVDDKLCEFETEAIYGPTLNDRPTTGPGDPGDLHPVRLGVRGTSASVHRLRVLRDIYYIATNSSLGNTTDYPHFDAGQRVINHMLSPQEWKQGDLFDRRKTVEFTMKKDQFFALGDNSPYSRDSRLWEDEHYVERDMLIGKAVLIYWPHAWRIGIPGTGVSLPIIPNVKNMGLIH